MIARAAIAAAMALYAVPSAAAPAPVVPILALPEQIDALLAARDLDAAAALIAGSTTSLPPNRVALARADYALASDEPDAALAGFTALTAEPSLAARAQLGIGLAQLRLGHDAPAIAALDLAVAADPHLLRAWIARGVAADRGRDWATADNAYAHALAIDPRSAVALANRGYSRLLRGHFVEAAADAQAALTIDPKLKAAANNLRLARAMQGDYKNAFVGSTKATLASDLNTVGFAAMSRGDYSMAETFFTRAMHISPQFDKTAWDNLVYLKQLDHRAADTGAPIR